MNKKEERLEKLILEIELLKKEIEDDSKKKIETEKKYIGKLFYYTIGNDIRFGKVISIFEQKGINNYIAIIYEFKSKKHTKKNIDYLLYIDEVINLSKLEI